MTDRYDIVIVGAGPAGSSAAIRLSRAGLRCLIVERSKFPRHKLCGEFVSPECLPLLDELDIHIDPMDASSIRRTVFYSANGNSLTIPSEWFGGGPALGISRRKLDLLSAEKALDVGVSVLYESSVTGVGVGRDGRPVLRVRRGDGEAVELSARLVIDASGRARAVARHFDRTTKQSRAPFIAFKTHLRGALVSYDTCEIYGFRGGYGGCNAVENGLHNVCFIIDARAAKASGRGADLSFRRYLLSNRRAAEVLSDVTPEGDWLAVPIDRYGQSEPVPAQNILAIGDSASFIDPFTGSGILLALQTSKLAAELIAAGHPGFDELAAEYNKLHRGLLTDRMAVSSAFRLAAFSPRTGNAVVGALSFAPGLARRLARLTRS